MIDGLKNSNFYGVEFKYTFEEIEEIEARRTKVEMLKRELGEKYILAPLYGKLKNQRL
jgi:hypothetical protein